MPTNSSSSIARSVTRCSSRLSAGVLKRESQSFACIRQCCPRRTLSRDDMYSKSLMFWKVRAMPKAATWCGLAPVISRPWKRIFPAVGGKIPVMPLKSVVFPAPFGPMSAKISPLFTSKGTSSTATRAVETRRAYRVGEVGGLLREAREDVENHVVDQERADDDTRDVPHPSEHHHDEDGDGDGETEILRGDQRKLGPVEGPREAAERRADAEGQQLDSDRVHAHRRGRDLVLADGHPCAAHARFTQIVHEDDGDRDEDDHDHVIGQRI